MFYLHSVLENVYLNVLEWFSRDRFLDKVSTVQTINMEMGIPIKTTGERKASIKSSCYLNRHRLPYYCMPFGLVLERYIDVFGFRLILTKSRVFEAAISSIRIRTIFFGDQKAIEKKTFAIGECCPTFSESQKSIEWQF